MISNFKINSRRLTWFFLVMGVVASTLAYWEAKVLVRQELGARLDTRTLDIRNSVEQQLRSYVDVLRGLQVQLMVHPDLSRREFQHAARMLELDKHLSGVQGVGLSLRVPAEKHEEFLVELRQELAVNTLGYPTSIEAPEMSPFDAHIINYEEPIARNAFGIGKDQAENVKRRAAIEYARDTGGIAVSEKVPLIVNPQIFNGLVFFMPIYRGGVVPATLQERRAKFVGTVFLVVRSDEMLHEIFAPGVLHEVDIEIYIRNNTAGVERETSSNNLLFDSGEFRSAETRPPELHANHKAQYLYRYETFDMGGSSWYLHVTELPEFTTLLQRWLPLLAVLCTILVIVIAFLILREIDNRRRVAERRVSNAERSLQTKEAELVHISNAIDDVLWTMNMPGMHIVFVSAAIERLAGWPAQVFYDNRFFWRKCIHPDDVSVVQAFFKGLAAHKQEVMQCRLVRRDGDLRWVLMKVVFLQGENPGTGTISGILTDITEQRRINESLMRNNRALHAIHQCEQVIASAKDEAALLQGVCEVMVSKGYRNAWAGVLQRETTAHIMLLGVAGVEQLHRDFIANALQSNLGTNGIIEEAIRTRRPVVLNRLAEDAHWAPWHQHLLQLGFLAKMTLPLLQGDKVLGVLIIYADEEDPFDHEEVALLQGLANSVAIGLHSYQLRLERQMAEAALQLRQRAIEAAANPIAISSAKPPGYPLEYINPAFTQVTGYPAEDILGKGFALLCRDDLDQTGLHELRLAHEQQREGHGEVRIYHRDGSTIWINAYVAPVREESGAVDHFVHAIYDITATRQYQQELEYQANYDTLTGLANRNLLRDRIGHAISYASTLRQQVWIVSINLDRFRFVNHTMGQAAGDLLLQQVAQRLQALVGATDTVARMAVDEFALLLTPEKDEDAVTTLLNSLMQVMAQPIHVKGQDFFVTCCAGIAQYPADATHSEALLGSANIALHRAKEQGRNNFRFYTAAMNQRAKERLRLEGDLQHALQRNELELHYQPQVDLRTGWIVGTEALLRWRHPQLGMIPPDKFIRIAEESGLIVSIGTWVMRMACQQNKAWQDAGNSALRISVNLSSSQFYQQDLIQSIAAILDETGLHSDCLDIELTEGIVMHDTEQAVGIMHNLKALGVKLSIDDFGTGYSSLSYLRRFPIDVLKVDQSFVRNVTTDPGQAAITHAIIQLARSLQLHVIAEGVETEDQLSYLRRHRCDEIQGFYFSRPLPAPELAALLTEGRRLPGSSELAETPQQTLLIVDDEENVTASLKRLLRKEGYCILRAHSAEEGFSLLARHEIQVILCDQRMPGMTGTEFLSKVKLLYPDTIRIMLSGYTAVESIIEATNSGAIFRFHTKPWDDDVLRSSIVEAFQYHWHRQAAKK